MNGFQRLLILCSGAVEDLMERDECRGDAKRYAMVGAFVLLTSVFAFFSAAFALYTGMRSGWLAAPLALAWACLIFNLDRFVVSSIRKSDTHGLAPSAAAWIRLKEFGGSVPRIVLAIVISLVVATPLELRLFEREINAQLQRNQNDQRATTDIALGQLFDTKALEEENKRLTGEIDGLRKQVNTTLEKANAELAGDGATRRLGDGPVYRDLMALAKRQQGLVDEKVRVNGKIIAANEKKIGEIEEARKQRQTLIVDTIAKADGFLARYGALQQLARSDSALWIVQTFVTLLFIIVELTPVIMKLLMRRGPYDDLLETIEHTVFARQKQTRSDVNDDIHAELSIHSLKNIERMRLEERMTVDAYDYDTIRRVAPDQLANAQERIADACIREWLRNQLASMGGARTPRVTVKKPVGTP